MKNQIIEKDLKNFLKELSFAQEYDGKNHKCLRIKFSTNYDSVFNIYFDGKAILSTTNIKDAVKQYNKL